MLFQGMHQMPCILQYMGCEMNVGISYHFNTTLSLATRRYYFIILYMKTYNICLHLRKGCWPTVGHLVRTNATRGGCTGSNLFLTHQAYRSAIYQQGMTFTYSLGSRLPDLTQSTPYTVTCDTRSRVITIVLEVLSDEWVCRDCQKIE